MDAVEIAKTIAPFATALVGTYFGIKTRVAALEKELKELREKQEASSSGFQLLLRQQHEDFEEKLSKAEDDTKSFNQDQEMRWNEINRTLGQVEGYLQQQTGRGIPPRPNPLPPRRRSHP